MISADAGSPRVLRFGEKGQMWLELQARGRAAHGAHVHLGDNAITRLMRAIEKIKATIEGPAEVPGDIVAAIEAAAPSPSR